MQTTNIQNPVVQSTNYGTYTPVRFTSQKWRLDIYKSGFTGEEVEEMVYIAGPNDLSPVVCDANINLGRGLNCYGCFNGHAHSINACLSSL